MPEQLKPELRFPEFDGDWSPTELERISQINPSTGRLPEVFIYIDLESVSDGQLLFENEIKSTDAPSRAQRVLKSGDILFQTVRAYQMNNYHFKLSGNYVASTGYAQIRANENQDETFLFYCLHTFNFVKEVLKRSTGTTYPAINSSDLATVGLNVPSFLEQQRIANFLKAIDKRIKLLKGKKEALEDYKNSIMQKLFAQEIRFKQDDGSDFPEWEEKRIDEVFDVTRGNVLAVPEMSDLQTGEYKYPVYSSQTKLDGLTGYYNEYLYQDAITWTTDGANAGEVKFRKGKFYCTNVCGVLISEEGYANSCIAQLLNRVTHRYVSYVGNPKLMNNVMAGVKVKFPHVDEQEKISEFIDSIKVKVDALSYKIEEIESYKKSMLQKMFV